MNSRAYRSYIPDGYLAADEYATKYDLTYGQTQYLLSIGKIKYIRIGRVRVLMDIQPPWKNGRLYEEKEISQVNG